MSCKENKHKNCFYTYFNARNFWEYIPEEMEKLIKKNPKFYKKCFTSILQEKRAEELKKCSYYSSFLKDYIAEQL
jgi:hypothetical protein